MISFLGASLILVEAGDYERDGHSELLFSLSLHNKGGYAFFSETFAEQARFEFSYH